MTDSTKDSGDVMTNKVTREEKYDGFKKEQRRTLNKLIPIERESFIPTQEIALLSLSKEATSL